MSKCVYTLSVSVIAPECPAIFLIVVSCTPASDNIEIKSYASEYGRPVEELLPEAGKLETGKGYRDKKAIPFLKKLKEKWIKKDNNIIAFYVMMRYNSAL